MFFAAATRLLTLSKWIGVELRSLELAPFSKGLANSRQNPHTVPDGAGWCRLIGGRFVPLN